MALPTVTSFTRVLASHLTSFKNHLEGAVGSTAPWHFRQSSGNFQVTLTDAAGATYFRLNDSGGANIFTIDSDGNMIVVGSITLSGGFVFPTSASPAQTTDGQAIWDSDDDVLTVGTGAATKRLGLTRGAGSSATATAELVYDTTAAALKVWNGSASVAVAPSGYLSATYKYKSATQTVSASSAFADVVASSGSFAFAIAASEVWHVRALLNLTFTGTGGLKLQFTGPASPTRVDVNAHLPLPVDVSGVGLIEPHWPFITEANLATSFSNTFAARGAAASTQNQYETGAPTNGTTSWPVYIDALIANGSTAGTVTLQMAQNAANGTTVAGISSWFAAERVA